MRNDEEREKRHAVFWVFSSVCLRAERMRKKRVCVERGRRRRKCEGSYQTNGYH